MAAVTAWRRWAGDAAAAAPEATVPSGPGGSPTAWYLPRRLFYPRNGGDPPLRLGQAVLGVAQGDGRPQALVCRAWPWPAAAHYDAVASCPPETVVLGDAGPWLADAADARDGGSGAPPSLVVYVPPATLASSICVRSASPGTTADDRVAAVVQQQLQGLFLASHALLTVSVPGQGPTTCEVVTCTGATDVADCGLWLVGPDTAVAIEGRAHPQAGPVAQQLERLGDLARPAYAALRRLILLPLQYHDILAQSRLQTPRGVLLHGPPGVGKTRMVSDLAAACNANLVVINGADCSTAVAGESEALLRARFEYAKRLQLVSGRPSILFLDELDALCPRREEGTSTTNRLVGQLLTLMDGTAARGDLIVLAATNRPNALDPAIRRPGRFDREIALPAPDRDERLAMLSNLTAHLSLAGDVDLPALAGLCPGYVAADLAALCREATLHAQAAAVPSSEAIAEAVRTVQQDDFLWALARIVPSTQRETVINLDKSVSWDCIGGQATAKMTLRRAVEWPLRYRETFIRLGLRPPRGILLYGPPGCSKTTMVKALAGTAGATFLSLNVASVYSAYVGEAERAVREVFSRARVGQPAVIFFDEIDALAGNRGTGESGGGGKRDVVQERVLSTLLNEMDGIQGAEGLLVVGATNKPESLDAALLRPGRFDEIVHVPAPDLEGRADIFRVHTRRIPLAPDVDLHQLAAKTRGYSGADIENVCREAAMMALRADLDAIVVRSFLACGPQRPEHFDAALAAVPSSLSIADFPAT